ncbi:MAG: flagellar basal body rod protein FlgB [Spirochaetaceae bacterium]|jgi:flagellar basal-body rod protein FlgB|nr:flagellar basal body rod protein FlgB [Spirochaetaceae bacterium]
MNNFFKTVDLIHRTLDAETVRREAIANNLANAEVPNFKRSEVNFESSLRRALESEGQRPLVEMTGSDPRHLSNYQPLDYRDVRPRRTLDYLTQSKSNGNNVDAEKEFQLLIENQIKYMLLAQSAAFEFRQVSTALR